MSREASTEGWVAIGCYVPPEMKREVVELSREKRTSVSEEIRVAIGSHLAINSAKSNVA